MICHRKHSSQVWAYSHNMWQHALPEGTYKKCNMHEQQYFCKWQKNIPGFLVHKYCTSGLLRFTYANWFSKWKPKNCAEKMCILLHNKTKCLCSQTLNNMKLVQHTHKAYITVQAKDQCVSNQFDIVKLFLRLQLCCYSKGIYQLFQAWFSLWATYNQNFKLQIPRNHLSAK